MANPRGFAKKMRAWADDIPKQVNEVKKQVASEIILQVVPATPVLTGQARSNYHTAINEPDRSILAFGPFTKDGYRSIAQMRQVIPRVKPGEPLYITNNLPYIYKLNDGSSKQAPKNFIEIAINEARDIIRRQRIRYRGY